ncbi:QVPTGV class sortase B protein-sorting domain-containing protein [Streptococcus salivarius]
MEGIIGTLEFYAPVLVLGIIVIGIVYFMKKRNNQK